MSASYHGRPGGFNCQQLFEHDLKFSGFVNDTGYFEQKIDCLDRAIYYYDEEQARKDIKEYLNEHHLGEYIIENEGFDFQSDEENINDFINDVLGDFSDKNGIGPKGVDKLIDIDEYMYDEIDSFGKKETGILELYMLAFKLAQEELKDRLWKENYNEINRCR